ncbi:MAG: DUF433 domain-containing protein [Chloroflexi bacterium]|nr:DUF433 domain-containing protein [Chloroflexota bacterium]
MATPAAVTYSRIVRDERIHGGEPVVAGTRVPVSAIVATWHAEHDLTAVLAAYPRLTAPDVAQALAYYDANRAEIDQLIRLHQSAL